VIHSVVPLLQSPTFPRRAAAGTREEIGMLFPSKTHHHLCKKIIHSLPTSIHCRPLIPKPISTSNLLNEEARGELEVGYDLLASESINSVSEGKQLHARILINGFHQNAVLGAKLVSIYGMHGSLIDARLVFDSIHRFKCKSSDDDDEVLLWNAMIRGYVKKGQCEQALELYGRMRIQAERVEADKVTLTSVLKACADLSELGLEQGKEVHHHIMRSGWDSDVSVSNGIVNMYAKCGSIEIARQQFDKIHQRNTVSWNTMISGYAHKGYAEDALKLFRQMLLLQHVEPNMVTFTSVLPAFAQLAALQLGKEIHAYIIRRGFVTEVFVLNALIDMYAKCRSLEDAQHLFDKMPKKDVGSWNSMIACYSRNGECQQALNIFHQMGLAGTQPDSVTIVTILPVCGQLEALQFGKKIHDFVISSGLQSSVMVCNALIDMYAKCRSLEIARQIFDAMSIKEVISWNAIIAGYSHNGLFNEALNLCRQMDSYGILPDSVTVTTILPISIQLGDLQQGKEIHNCIIKNGFNSEVSVGNALLDMYVKCGSLQAARHVFDRMLRRDLLSWSGMIAGYGMHGDGMEALTLFYKMEQAGVKPDHITFIGVLSACSHAGLVDEGWLHFNRMRRHYRIAPMVDHYACMVDLLGRAGSAQ
jgi:pentatricopeptide repeat protein